ncbi:hypothetical protein O6H91_18G067700 [Diphasiastrum complanatum]|uniref:Uncharacterized protein n=1 Tax=Diphasiastrum complanatum TaxID=34168 RepID=A0ACC2B2B9_DIPCM|nr:hypothetical protein O6H91_18G067700 [Diphasiastrum complanatum]
MRKFPPIRSYAMRVLKEVLLAAEQDGCEVLESLYEEYLCYLLPCKDNKFGGYKTYTYAATNQSQTQNLPSLKDGVVTIRISSNILEGGTGCYSWPAGLLLTELIFTYRDLFTAKSCLELGSGAGLVGVSLARIQASKVVLTDGDLITLSNLRHNLLINGINVAEHEIADNVKETSENSVQVLCKQLCWESAFRNKDEIHAIDAEIILGADLIYDPTTVPDLVSVLVTLLSSRRASSKPKSGDFTNREHPVSSEVKVSEDSNGFWLSQEPYQSSKHQEVREHPGSDTKDSVCSLTKCNRAGFPVAYFTTAKRNIKTLNFFFNTARAAGLQVLDVTESMQPFHYLQGLCSLDRSSILIHKLFW